MASLSLTQEELKAVEQSRQRLSQLSNSIGSLKNNVFTGNPLPRLESLQASADILQLNLRAILEIVSQNNDLFTRVAVHPSTNFPGRTQENILLQLLRKKAEPDVEDAMEEGRKTIAALPTVPTANTDPGMIVNANGTVPSDQDKERELEDGWTGTREACVHRIMDYALKEEPKPFTAEEQELGVENVRTGLRRTFDDEYEDYDDDDDEDDDEEEDSEGDDDVMEIDRPPPPPAPAVVTHEMDGATLENVMRFAARGQFVAG
ncbi:Uu.00g033350.m01.CDS01 [Anthostomella pinea]|uniref:Mediator of RNA polymerase II transcription subunit 8 n=1 Tax=Anthostomella pinea TaxID=933095 RepID=A0AAI8V9C5_9PEZI|nr:Uu.00g033350.m01.CDS01 [Anthostomella pinea]